MIALPYDLQPVVRVGARRPTWLESVLGVPIAAPAPDAPSVVRVGHVEIAALDGYAVHVVEVQPGLYLVGEYPDGAVRVGVDPRAVNAATAAAGGGGGGGGVVTDILSGLAGAGNIYTGVAQAAAGVITGIGDWVAGFFPKAAEAKAMTANASTAVQLDLADQAQTLLERQQASDDRALRLEKRRAKLDEAAEPATPITVTPAPMVRILRPAESLTPTVGCSGGACKCGGTCGGGTVGGGTVGRGCPTCSANWYYGRR